MLLDHEFAQEVRDLILKPPGTNAYDTLKATLVQRPQSNVASNKYSVQRNWETVNRPDSFVVSSNYCAIGLQPLIPLSSESCFCSVSHQVYGWWSDTADLDKLAMLADKVVEVASPSVPSISSVNSTSSRDSTSEIQQLRFEIADLKCLVHSITPKDCPHRSSSGPSRKPQLSSSHTSSPEPQSSSTL